MIHVLIVDDDPEVRRGLRMRLELEADLRVAGEAGDGEQALHKALALRPDVVVMDIRLPGLDGLAAAEQIRTALPGCAIVILTLYDTREHREAAARAGVTIFIGKHGPEEELVRAIRRTRTRGDEQLS